MLLGNLLKSIKKDYQRIPIRGISFDSRKVKKKDIFFAIRGTKKSGIKFMDEAISKKASVIVTSERNKLYKKKIPVILVKDVRKSLSEACYRFYKKKPKNIVAVTGTNGKSSVAHFFYQILVLNKISAASIGTLGILSKHYNKKTNLTSLDPLILNKSLDILAKRGVNNVILEASSHGLNQKRLNNININVGIFTNLSHDHLDYHKNMKSYFNSKAYLFKKLLTKNSKIITDEDNKEFKILRRIGKKRKIRTVTIGSNSGNIKILFIKYKQDKQIVKVSVDSKIFRLEIPLIGKFQIKNLFMAIIAATECGINQNQIFSQISKIKSVPGRLERVAKLKNESIIIVDFAHTPDALKQSLIALKNQFKKEIILVFGCGGERDKKKRFEMGKVASKYCRKIFVTDDNPRNENPEEIRNAIMKGCNNSAVNIGNRKKAINAAINELSPNEILLVAGKGHEETQNLGKKIIFFSYKKVIKDIVNKKNFFRRTNNHNFPLSNVFSKNIDSKLIYNGVSINSKNIKKNNLFFSIQGKKTDGHKFAIEAVKKGAVKSVVSKKVKTLPKNKTIRVKNTFTVLNNLAKNNRHYTSAEIIGITGSVGKTTLKNLISFSLKSYGKVYQSPHSYNNKFGVPVSLCNLKSNVNFGVFEIGMDKKGEIDNLSKIVKPEIGIITSIAPAHFKNFTNLKGIAKAKAEIIANIPRGGDIILNSDSIFFKFFSNIAQKKGVNITSFSKRKRSDIFLLSIKKIKNIFRLKINVKNKIFYFDTKYSTNNFINNVLACISTLRILNLNLHKMKKRFISFKIPEGRGDIQTVKKFNKKFKLIDESYNANPSSMKSAINNMNYHNLNKRFRKLAFLGDMLELGNKSKKFHRNLSFTINKSDINKIYVYGRYIRETYNNLSSNKKGKMFKNLSEAYDHFSKNLRNNDLLMVKGSNATGLNKFSKYIKKGQ